MEPRVATIRNPVLPGFNPDPSIVRVDDDYYIATSTFEWFPGVVLSHSRDLVHWRTVGHALDGTKLEDLRGVHDSAGVWAPSLSWYDGTFWLVYTVVVNARGGHMDLDNYLVTAPTITGPWSDPTRLNSSGFDASMFHDDDGRHWVTNVQWDARVDHPSFGGIILQEYDPAQAKLVGEVTTLLRKDVLIEGPNLYRHGGWYYLMLAEGGTGWEHGISMARSRTLMGPYETDPHEAVFTSRHDPDRPLQKVGHGELVETPSDGWWMVHLASRPVHVGDGRYCILGRETCLQRVAWDDEGWLRGEDADRAAAEVAAPAGLPWTPWPQPPTTDAFTDDRLGLEWASLRGPVDDSWASTTERPGWLRLRGRQSLHSRYRQSLVAQRVRLGRCRATTALQFAPTQFAQAAGLVAWYGTDQYYYLHVTFDEVLGTVVGVSGTDDGTLVEIASPRLMVGDWGLVHLRAVLDDETLQFCVSRDGASWQPVGSALPAWKLSDDYGSHLRFTGLFFGLCAQDLNGTLAAADFSHFTLEPLDS